MSFNLEQKQAILEYGEAKYAMGYKDGYISGILSGGLLSIIGFLAINLCIKSH
jgi:hypothetical protein